MLEFWKFDREIDMHYVIGDVHGCFDEMMDVIHQIESQDKHAQIIFVGDFVDRGPQVGETLDWCMEHIVLGSLYQSVMGNHEDLVLMWYESGCCLGDTEPVEYLPTLFDFSDFLHRTQKPLSYVKQYVSWIETLPYYLDVEASGVTYRIVHGWEDFSLKKEIPIRETRLTARELNGNYLNDTVVVHGHTPSCTKEYRMLCQPFPIAGDEPGKIVYRHNAINLDGGCVFAAYHPFQYCGLCGVCLETLEEFYSGGGRRVKPQNQYYRELKARLQ